MSTLARKNRQIDRLWASYEREPQSATLLKLMQLHLDICEPARMVDCISLLIVNHRDHPLRDRLLELSCRTASEERAITSRLRQASERVLTQRYKRLLSEHLEPT